MKRIKKIGRLFGCDIIQRSKDHKLYENHLMNVLKSYRVNCVLDVGANLGQYGKLLRSRGYKGRIISFEPVKATFETLLAVSSKDPAWDVYNYALGNEDVSKAIKVTKNSDLSSFLKPNMTLDKLCASAGHCGGDVEKEEFVSIRRLDTVFSDVTKMIVGPVQFALKMDTQGYDLEVFRGAVKTLHKIAVLQSEISNVPLYQDMPDFLTVLNVYVQRGFELTGLFPESRNEEDLRVVEFNGIMVQKKLLPAG